MLRVMCLLSLACVLAFSQTALAGECAPSFNWTGPYLGLHFGYGWGTADDTNFAWLPAFERASFPSSTLSPAPNGFVGGAQVGYNWQCGCFVYGIEADFSGSGMSGSQTISPSFDAFEDGHRTTQENINWFGTVRPTPGMPPFNH
ncbi:MAG: outer membrane protein [Syntrophobacteraceae bacterium]